MAHKDATLIKVRHLVGTILNSFYTKGGQQIAPALQIFLTKVDSSIEHCPGVGESSKFITKGSTALPVGTPVAYVGAEVDWPSAQTKIQVKLFEIF